MYSIVYASEKHVFRSVFVLLFFHSFVFISFVSLHVRYTNTKTNAFTFAQRNQQRNEKVKWNLLLSPSIPLLLLLFSFFIFIAALRVFRSCASNISNIKKKKKAERKRRETTLYRHTCRRSLFLFAVSTFYTMRNIEMWKNAVNSERRTK